MVGSRSFIAGLLERGEGRGDDCANALQALLLRQTVLARNILNQFQRFGERWKLVRGEDDVGSIDLPVLAVLRMVRNASDYAIATKDRSIIAMPRQFGMLRHRRPSPCARLQARPRCRCPAGASCARPGCGCA